VHRVGTISAIIGRLRERIDGARATLDRCRRCNGPAFLSRGGQPTCAAICWERHVEPVVPAPAQPPKPTVHERHAAPAVETIPVMGKRGPKAPLAVEW
jgi:hypothetical protein